MKHYLVNKEKLLPHQQIDREIDIPHQNVLELFCRQAGEAPDKTFLLSPGISEDIFSYRQFRDHFLTTARYLRQMNLGKGDRINLILPNSPEFLLLYFAALALGLVVVPINQDLAPVEMLYIIQDCRSGAVFYDQKLHAKVDPLESENPGIPFVPLGELPDFDPLAGGTSLEAEDVVQCLKDVESTDTAVIIYTSGTTGNPKGVVLSHLNLLGDAGAIARWFQFSNHTRTLCILPLFHNNGQVVTLLAPLFAGGSTVIVRGKASLLSFWGLVKKYRVTWTSVMPSILSILLSLPRQREDETMRGIICGGQVLIPSVRENFEERFRVPIFEGYGLTETTSFSCYNNFPADSRIEGTIGRPLPINEMAVLDQWGNELGPHREGQIAIRGYNVAREYLGLAEKNREVFKGGWFLSGDYGCKDEEGYFYFKGRTDSLIIKGGENIYPAELENLLFQHPAVAECAVIGVPDRLLGEDVVAFVKQKEDAGTPLTESALKEFCRDKIANFKQARRILIIDELEDLQEIPKTPTKKVLYRKLREYYLSRFQE